MIDFVLKLLDELQYVPGLGFLGRLKEQLMDKQDLFEDNVERLEKHVSGAERGAEAIKNLKGSKRNS